MIKRETCTAIVLAAGSGKRMGGTVQKQFLELKGKPVVCHSLEVFEKTDFIDEIILVTGEAHIVYCREEIVRRYGYKKVSSVVAGGAERFLSVWEGLKAIRQEEQQSGYVFIHDGARPFITREILERAYCTVKKYKACVVGMPVKDTIKIADADGFAQLTPKRSLVWMIQTPQVFETALIKEAYAKLIAEGRNDVTDDAMVVEMMTDYKVKLVEGSYRNMKLTTPEDLNLALTLFDA